MTRAERWLAALALALIAAVAVVWVLAALVLPIDNWDGFEYLLNARRLAGHDLEYVKYGWVPLRPPLLSVFLAPVVAGYSPRGTRWWARTWRWWPSVWARWR